jgi:hypothetical protein
MHRSRGRAGLAAGLTALALVLVTTATGATDPFELVPGTAVLLSQTGGGGSGGTSSTTSRTHIFSPSVFVDYKRFGGEPTVTVDRFPFTTNVTIGNKTLTCTPTAPCFPDIAYVSGPNGFVFPHYSPFFKSDDLGETFRVPPHVPSEGQTFGTGGGGGDSHQVVGQKTHKVFFVDLPGPGCVTMNVSADQGESWLGDNLGCGQNPGAIDDRQWVAVDENAPLPAGNTGNVYVSFINFTNVALPNLGLARSTHDGAFGSFVADSVCNTLVGQIPSSTTCPDPADPDLAVAGPPVVDYYGTHNIYIPFVRATPIIPGVSSGPPYSLWIAKSTDGGSTWTRNRVALLGAHNPVNLFPEMAVDKAGNLYYTWSQTQGPGSDTSGLLGEQDVYYTFSTDKGATWVAPIPLTQSANDTAVMPWMVAGDAGRVDIVYYKANNGANSNTSPPGTVWNVFFGHSLNALNTGSNFSNVQISDHPNHLGGVCTAGLACSGDRDLLDFFTIDIDHLGAANVVWADDNSSRGSDTRNKFSRQLAGPSLFKNQTIALMNTWPVRDHAATDRAGDTFDVPGLPKPICPGMDLLGTSANRTGDTITISLTLDSAPTAAKAIACGGAPVTGGVWAAEFWAATPLNPDGTGYGESFYLGYRDNPPDGAPHGEAGRMSNLNLTVTSLEYEPLQGATVGGTCSAVAPPAPCTVTLTTTASTLGIKSGAGMYSITGLSTFYGGTVQTPPFLRIALGNSEQSDAVAPFDVNGTGSTP